MIRHIVVFRMNRPVDPAARTAFLDAVASFGENPPFADGPAVIRVDLDARPEGRSVSEALMEVDFADLDTFRNYLAHPAHIALVNDVLTPNLESWLSVQSEL